MTTRGSLQRAIASYEGDAEFEFEELLLDINEQIVAQLQQSGMRRSELADKLGVSRAFVTKLLSGEENVTLKTLIRVANALGTKVRFNIGPGETSQRWETIANTPMPTGCAEIELGLAA